MKKNGWMCMLIALSLSVGCGSQAVAEIDSLIPLQPRVESIFPEDGAVVPPDASVQLVFTQPVLADTVSRATLAVVDAGDAESLDDLVDDVLDGDVEGLHGIYEVLDGGRQTVFRPQDGFTAGTSYLVIATPRILGPGLLPLNQRPGETPRPFVSGFTVASAANGDASATGADGPGEDGEEAEVVRVRPSFLIIHELLYDAVGSDSDGDVFVELSGEAGGDITGYTLVFVNGEDGVVKDTVELPDDAIVPEDGLFVIADAKTGSPGVSDVVGADSIINFDPQNGPDCVQLLDAEGGLLDALGYGQPIVDPAENGLACFEGTPAEDVSSGQSLSRRQGEDTNENAADFETLAEPTPGKV